MASLQSNSTFSFKHHLTGEAWPAFAGLFFSGSHFARRFIRKWVNPTFPDPVRSIAHIVCLIKSKLYVDRRRSPGLGVFSGEGGSKRITTYPVQVPVLRYSSACKTMFVPVLSYIGRTYDIQRPCQASMPRLSSGV